MGGLSIPGQDEQDELTGMRQQRCAGSTLESLDCPVTPPFIDPVVRAGVTTRIERSDCAPAHGPATMTGSGSTLLPARWFQAAESSRSEHQITVQ